MSSCRCGCDRHRPAFLTDFGGARAGPRGRANAQYFRPVEERADPYAFPDTHLSHFRSHLNGAARARCAPRGDPWAQWRGQDQPDRGRVAVLARARACAARPQDMARRPEALGWKVTGLLQPPRATRSRFLVRDGAARQVGSTANGPADSRWAALPGCCGWCPRWTGSGSRRRGAAALSRPHDAELFSPIMPSWRWPMKRRCANATNCSRIRCATALVCQALERQMASRGAR